MQKNNVVSRSGAGWVRAGERRRVAAAFAGYLVTDGADSLPIWRGIDGRVTLLVLTYKRVFGLRDLGGGWLGVSCMDAPYFLPTGSVVRNEMCGEYCAAVDAIQRGRYAL